MTKCCILPGQSTMPMANCCKGHQPPEQVPETEQPTRYGPHKGPNAPVPKVLHDRIVAKLQQQLDRTLADHEAEIKELQDAIMAGGSMLYFIRQKLRGGMSNVV